jgi:2-methylcitrate dehydratase PrpD
MPDICMQHMVAIMLLDGIVTFESSHDEKRMKHPRVLEMRRRVELHGDDELTRVMPSRQGKVALRLKDGREFSIHVKAVRGTADNPMTRAEVDEKAYHLMAPILGSKRSRALCDAVWAIDKLNDVRKLRPLVRA